MWNAYKKGYKAWLQLEKSLADHSVEAYLHDVQSLTDFLQAGNDLKNPDAITLKDLENFTRSINELGLSHASQARMISGLRSFFKYCLTEDIITTDPAALLEAPKQKRKL